MGLLGSGTATEAVVDCSAPIDRYQIQCDLPVAVAVTVVVEVVLIDCQHEILKMIKMYSYWDATVDTVVTVTVVVTSGKKTVLVVVVVTVTVCDIVPGVRLYLSSLETFRSMLTCDLRLSGRDLCGHSPQFCRNGLDYH